MKAAMAKENSAKALTEGYESLIIDPQPYLMGYLSILNVCLTRKFGFSGMDIDTVGAFVDKNNLGAIAPLVESHIR